MVAEASTIEKAGGSDAGVDAWTDIACLSIKSSSAERLGAQALARLQGDRATDARPLADRVQRHAVEARSALERAASTLAVTEAEARRPAVVVAPAEPEAHEPTHAGFRWAVPAVAAAAVVTAVVLLPGWIDRSERGESAREGTLGGNEPSAASLITPSPVSNQDGVAAEEEVLTFDFDEERMDLGIGARWRPTVGGADAVALAGFPTAVNRSARLENVDGAGAEACHSAVPSPARLTRLAADVLVSDEPATAAIIVRTSSGGEVRVNLGTSESSMVIDGAVAVARERALRIAEWYQVAIAIADGRTLWRVEGGDPSAPFIEQSIDIDAFEAVDEVCLAISNDSTGQTHFDNVTIATTQGG